MKQNEWKPVDVLQKSLESVQVLSTKLYVPPVRTNAVTRLRLIEKLLSGVGCAGSFSLVSGPAGFGKTTLLSEFVSHLQQSAAWVSLDDGDNEPARFWTHLIMACQQCREGIGASALALLGSSQPLPDDTIPTILINDLASLDHKLVLILDDYHAVQNPVIHKTMSFLLEHLPENLHVVVSTRIDPPWSLARYRARNQLIEIRAQDLRFSVDEAKGFLSHTMGLDLPDEKIADLERRTEGWIAGLQLAALSLQNRSDTDAFIQAFAGSHIFVADYLIEEVLQRQPQDVQTFLLETAILERLNARLCEAVTGREDGQMMLTILHQTNVFVVSLDDQRQWFRYHHLFADLLQARLHQMLPAKTITMLHQRAAYWYQEHGFANEAVNHFLAAQDFESVASLVEQIAHTLVSTGRISILRMWLEVIPEDVFHTHPRLTFYLFWIDLLQSKADLSDQSIQAKEDLLRALPPSPENDRLRGELMAVVCRAMVLSGRTSHGIHLAQEALEYLAENDLSSRARVYSALAIAHGFEGAVEKAEQVYRECMLLANAASDYRLAAHTTMAMALIQSHCGRLHDAAHAFQTIIDMGKNTNMQGIFFPAGQGYIGLASVYLEWNDLDMAAGYLERGMELCRQGGVDGIFLGQTLLSRLRQAQGDLDSALEALQSTEQAFQRADDFTVTIRQIEIALAAGDIDGAARWAAPLEAMLSRDTAVARPPLLFEEIIEAAVIRVFLVQGEIEKALHWLDRLQGTAEPGKFKTHLIDVHLLRALAYQKQASGHVVPEAAASFKRALQLAEPENFRMIFLQAGPVMIPLLTAVIHDRGAPERVKDYARTLLDAFGVAGEVPLPEFSGKGTDLIEPLTPREMDVLGHIVAGDSNQTIADQLVITLSTVKKHTSNIFGKLNVSNRTQAAARARELGLFPSD